MILISKKPVTQSQRNLIKLNNKHLNKQPILKKNLKGLKNSNGRNNSGKITIRHKGNGHKKKYRIINFNRRFKSIGITISIEYDPNRNSNIAVIFDLDRKHFFYILAPKDLTIGDIVKSGSNNEPKIGYSMPLLNIPIGSFIHNISSKKLKLAQISRSAGTFSILKEKTLNDVKIKLSSGETKLISSDCYATIGMVSNEFAFLTRLGKAGQSRWLNCRPTVRGVAMNPIDHPHGGGEGKKSGNNKTPWGKVLQKRKKQINYK
uniref:Ribosomal protein L2 n=1 Tax=Amicula sp. isolate GU52X-4 cfCalB7 TaxID=3003489 RepID=A0A9E9C258_9STRA|nr:ribosomal protein L2 [Amicula sp. isolate GU52X-4 cfCalB7]